MEVSNSSGTNSEFTVRGVGGGSPRPPKGGSRTGRGNANPAPPAPKRRKLKARTFRRITPPPGELWIIQFFQGEEMIAEEKVRDARALVVLVQESDGSFKIHVSRNSTAAA